VIYALSAESARRVAQVGPSPDRTVALSLWGAQQAFNAAWSPLFFGRQQPKAALLDIGLLGATLIGYGLPARRVSPLSGALVLPYVAWVGFAAFLNEEVVRKNA
jgi:tryptophan-rich sensory protein